MMTAARFVAAIFMALAACVVILVVLNVYPGLSREGLKMMIAGAIVSMFVGWFSLGKKVAAGEHSAANLGVKAGISAFIWVLAVFAINHMILGMLSQAYYQPMSAVLQLPIRMIEYGKAALNFPIMGTIIGLSIFAGWVSKGAFLRWDQPYFD